MSAVAEQPGNTRRVDAFASSRAGDNRQPRALPPYSREGMRALTDGELEIDAQTETTQHKVVVVTLRDLLDLELPPREMLLSPWLTTQSLSMIYGWRGTGKTHVALGIANALASGESFLNWTAERPVPVLYIDGEMPGAVLQARLAAIVASNDREPQEGLLRLITPDLQPDGVMPDLGTRDGQDAIEPEIGDARVIIVDNISCMVRSAGKENDAESWVPVASWALRQRAHGKAVVFIHHSGKGGQQRGTSKREDLLDSVLALRRPSDYQENEGARFEVHFEKARDLHGQRVDPIEAKLDTSDDGRQVWAWKNASHAMRDRVIELTDLGMNQHEIAQELGCNKSTVCRHLKAAVENGDLEPPRRKGMKV